MNNLSESLSFNRTTPRVKHYYSYFELIFYPIHFIGEMLPEEGSISDTERFN